jgi:hypothetical protein
MRSSLMGYSGRPRLHSLGREGDHDRSRSYVRREPLRTVRAVCLHRTMQKKNSSKLASDYLTRLLSRVEPP